MYAAGSHFQSIALAVGGLYSQHCLQLSQTIYTVKGAQEVEEFYAQESVGVGKTISSSTPCLVRHVGNNTTSSKPTTLHLFTGVTSVDICRHPNMPWLYEVEGLQLYPDELDAILYGALKQDAQWQTVFNT